MPRPVCRRPSIREKSRSVSDSGEGSGRLVQNEDPRLTMECPRISTSCFSPVDRPFTRRAPSSGNRSSSRWRRASSNSARWDRSGTPAIRRTGPADQDVLRHRQLRKQVELLVDDADAQLQRLPGALDVRGPPVDPDGARVARVGAGKDLDERGLAGAVRPDEGVDFPLVKAEADPPECRDAVKRFSDVVELEEH